MGRITLGLLSANANNWSSGCGNIRKSWTSVLEVREGRMPANEHFLFPDWATAKDVDLYGIDKIGDFSYIYSGRGWKLS